MLPSLKTKSKNLPVVYQDKQVIFERGDKGTKTYKIVSGKVSVLIKPPAHIHSRGNDSTTKIITTLKRGQTFGELASFSPSNTRTATCVAKGETRLLLERTSSPKRKDIIRSKSKLTLNYKQPISKTIECQEKDIILKQGDSNDDDKAFYVILSGCVDVLIDNQKVNTLTAGMIFGEGSIMNNDDNVNSIRSASCIAASSTVHLIQIKVNKEALSTHHGLRRLLERQNKATSKRDEIRHAGPINFKESKSNDSNKFDLWRQQQQKQGGHMNGIIGVADSKNGTSSLIGGEKIKMIARDEQTHIKNSKKMTENEKDIHVADLLLVQLLKLIPTNLNNPNQHKFLKSGFTLVALENWRLAHSEQGRELLKKKKICIVNVVSDDKKKNNNVMKQESGLHVAGKGDEHRLKNLHPGKTWFWINPLTAVYFPAN